MCGIAGIMAKAKGKEFGPYLEKLMDALHHRGPDGRGVFTNDHLAFVHCRLSIIDLEGGAQPIRSHRNNVIVANGEIYNDLELRAQLGPAAFKTHSDSETPLALYEAMGEDFGAKLRGMYALAIYDQEKDLLILQRDPYGIKPLYYAETPDFFLFASEPQALLHAQLLPPRVDPAKAVELLQLKFTTSRQTVFEGIERVLPGETLFVREGRIERRTRQNPFLAAPEEAPMEITKAMSRLNDQLIDSVGVHTRSDVPYGVFLSGGVDSCSIVAAMSRLGIRGFPCYTVRFPESGLHDESTVARDVAIAAGAQHIEVEIGESDFWATLPGIIQAMDDPCLDPAMVPFYILAQRAAQDVKVVLCGNGGDEIFAGYRRYERAALPGFLGVRPLRASGQFDGGDFAEFSAIPWRSGFAASEEEARIASRTTLQRLQATDGADFLPHFILNTLDRTLMAHGVEGRTPFLDSKLSAFGYNLPDRLKLRGFKGKWLLRKWLQEALPVAKPFTRKRGFSVPVAKWIAKRGPQLSAFVCDQPGVRELFSVDGVRLLFNTDGEAREALRWPILFYAMWHQTHILGAPRPIFSPA